MSPEPYLLWRCQLFSSSLLSMKISRCYPLQPDHYPGIHSQWGLTLELILSHLWHQPCVFLLLLWFYHEDEVPLRSFSFQMLLCVWVLECVFVCVCVCVCECVCVWGIDLWSGWREMFSMSRSCCTTRGLSSPEIPLPSHSKEGLCCDLSPGWKRISRHEEEWKWIEFVRMGEDIWRAGRVKGELSLLRVNSKFL